MHYDVVILAVEVTNRVNLDSFYLNAICPGVCFLQYLSVLFMGENVISLQGDFGNGSMQDTIP